MTELEVTPAVASMQNTVDDGATKFSMTIGNELDLESDENVGVEETLEAIFRDGFDDSPLLSLPIDISHSMIAPVKAL